MLINSIPFILLRRRSAKVAWIMEKTIFVQVSKGEMTNCFFFLSTQTFRILQRGSVGPKRKRLKFPEKTSGGKRLRVGSNLFLKVPQRTNRLKRRTGKTKMKIQRIAPSKVTSMQ